MLSWLPCFRKKDNKKLEELKKDIELDEHAIAMEELFTRLGTSAGGLSRSDAKDKITKEGPNSLTPPPTTPTWVKLVKELFGGFNFLLWAAAAASLAAYFMEKNEYGVDASNDNLYLAIVLAIVVTITGLFSFFQDRKSGNIIKSFSNMIPPMAHVLRDGHVTDIRVEELVRGDIVDIMGGDKVPADIRIITSRGLKVDNSSLTGESEPQSRNSEYTHKNPLETKNLCLFSTSVLEGSARGIVILTGDHTVVGRIAALTAQVESGPSPISKEISHFIRIVSYMAFGIGIAFFILSLVYGYTFLQAVVFFMGIVVANVPEAIMATVTVCLTLTAQKMKKKFCLVKNLEAVETLGSTSTICSDKTGTLTQNRMTVTHIWFNDIVMDAQTMDPSGRKDGEVIPMTGSYEHLMRCATLCSKSHFRSGNDFSIPLPKRETTGDASEVAIMKYCELTWGDGGVDSKREKAKKICEIPFNSTNKFQVSIHDIEAEGRYLLVMKGAPERILSICDKVSINGQTVPKTDEFCADFKKAYETLGGYGERVLGFCDLDLDVSKYPKGTTFDAENPNFPLKGLRFLGLISMIDPPRPGVPQAVHLCQSAGIKVVMVTGDHPITAKAIASQVHIFEEGEDCVELIEDDPISIGGETYGKGRLRKTNAIVVHGEQLKKLSPNTLQQIVGNYTQVVFARTSPAQKLQIVEAYQKNGDVVGVTGDGVNDAPALRKADIGIAMGIAGTDVSKQAADMILMNDNFASIVTGIEEGRLIFDNLKKSIAYTLTSNVPEVTPFVCYILLGIPLPMSVVAILMIDLGTDLWPPIALAYEVPESDIMTRPPRNAAIDRLVNLRLICYSYLQIGFLLALSGFASYFTIMMWHGFKPQTLIGIREQWDSKYVQNVKDSYGQEWGYAERKALEACCHGGFFFALVVTRWADVLITKTRKLSLVQQGMENNVLNIGIFFTMTVAAICLNVPWIDSTLKVTGLRTSVAMTAIPWAILVLIFDELRRFAIRKWPNGWVYKETYY